MNCTGCGGAIDHEGSFVWHHPGGNSADPAYDLGWKQYHLDCREGTPKADPVNAPAHYRWLPNGIEVIDITESFGFLLGNVLKYVMRADHKGKPIEDLEKARWYLDREIAKRKNSGVL